MCAHGHHFAHQLYISSMFGFNVTFFSPNVLFPLWAYVYSLSRNCKYTLYICGIYHKGRRILLELKGGIWNLALENLGKWKTETSIYWVWTSRCQQCPGSGVQQWSQQSLYKRVSKQDSTNMSGMKMQGERQRAMVSICCFRKGWHIPIWSRQISGIRTF